MSKQADLATPPPFILHFAVHHTITLTLGSVVGISVSLVFSERLRLYFLSLKF